VEVDELMETFLLMTTRYIGGAGVAHTHTREKELSLLLMQCCHLLSTHTVIKWRGKI
jgi:hypothetical protein